MRDLVRMAAVIVAVLVVVYALGGSLTGWQPFVLGFAIAIAVKGETR